MDDDFVSFGDMNQMFTTGGNIGAFRNVVSTTAGQVSRPRSLSDLEREQMTRRVESESRRLREILDRGRGGSTGARVEGIMDPFDEEFEVENEPEVNQVERLRQIKKTRHLHRDERRAIHRPKDDGPRSTCDLDVAGILPAV